MAETPSPHGAPPAAQVLDVRALAPRLRHARLLEAFEALVPGQALLLVSDHDLRPLCDRLQAERPGALGWRYLETGPDTWRVEVRKGAVAAPGAPGPPPEAPRPAALAALPADRQVHVDVRADIQRGEEPFARIMAAARGLGEADVLVLRAPFEPVPLYAVLGTRGLAHWAEQQGPADWVIWFYREAAAGAAPAAAGGAGAPAGPARVRLDVRGLEPPQPMVRVLEAVEALAPGHALEVLHDRRPMFLYPQLEARGLVHETDEPEPGVVRILIRRPGR